MKKITGLMAMLVVAGSLALPAMARDRDDYGRGRDEARRTVTYNYNYDNHDYRAHRDFRDCR